AATTAIWGGSVVSMLGIIDRISSWRKTAAEVEKLRAEARKTDAEARKLMDERKADAEARKADAEARKADAEARKAEVDVRKAAAEALRAEAEANSLCAELQKNFGTREELMAKSQPKPASALLSQDWIDGEAKNRGIWAPLATHLIN